MRVLFDVLSFQKHHSIFHRLLFFVVTLNMSTSVLFLFFSGVSATEPPGVSSLYNPTSSVPGSIPYGQPSGPPLRLPSWRSPRSNPVPAPWKQLLGEQAYTSLSSSGFQYGLHQSDKPPMPPSLPPSVPPADNGRLASRVQSSTEVDISTLLNQGPRQDVFQDATLTVTLPSKKIAGLPGGTRKHFFGMVSNHGGHMLVSLEFDVVGQQSKRFNYPASYNDFDHLRNLFVNAIYDGHKDVLRTGISAYAHIDDKFPKRDVYNNLVPWSTKMKKQRAQQLSDWLNHMLSNTNPSHLEQLKRAFEEWFIELGRHYLQDHTFQSYIQSRDTRSSFLIGLMNR